MIWEHFFDVWIRTVKDSPFRCAVFAAVNSIPRGKVTTYGLIAEAIDAPRQARQVGMAIARGDSGDAPAHRVVNRDGFLTGGWAFGHPDVMRQMLEDEGVGFLGDYRVNLARHLWEPRTDRATMAEIAACYSSHSESKEDY